MDFVCNSVISLITLSRLSREHMRFRSSGSMCCSYLGLNPMPGIRHSRVLVNQLTVVCISLVNLFYFNLTNIHFAPAVWHNWEAGRDLQDQLWAEQGSLPLWNFHLPRKTSTAVETVNSTESASRTGMCLSSDAPCTLCPQHTSP